MSKKNELISERWRSWRERPVVNVFEGCVSSGPGVEVEVEVWELMVLTIGVVV